MKSVAVEKNDYRLERMAEEHREAVIDIFNHYVESSFAAYPDTKLDYAFFDHLMAMCRGYCAVVIRAGSGEVVGFALLRAYHPAATLKRTAEVSYFIAPGHIHKGLGRVALERLIAEARTLGIDRLLASVSSRNQESLAFHRKYGFSECGCFREVGRKFGQDFDIVWFERKL